MFDPDNRTVIYFVTSDTGVDEGTYTGDFSTGVTINWAHGQFTETFTHKSSGTPTLIDENGSDWEFRVCDVDAAQDALDALN